MSEGGRKHEHIEPSQIAGSDLPNWMRRRGVFAGIIHSLPVAIVLWAIIIAAGWQLIAHLPAGWSL